MSGSTIVAEIDPRGVDEVLPAIPNASSLLFHTGNIINRGFVYRRSPTVTEEIKLTCAKTLGKWLASINKHETKHLSAVDMDYSQITNVSGITEDRQNLKVTVKLFVVSAGAECVKEALNIVGSKLGTGHVETLILSLPGSSHGTNLTYNGGQSGPAVGPFWEAAESVFRHQFNDLAHHSQCCVSNEADVNHSEEVVNSETSNTSRSRSSRGGAGDVFISWTLGLSDLNAASLRDLHDHAQTEKPSLDQINMDVCCSPPEDLVALCNERDIQLLTHNDPREILSGQEMHEILSSHLSHHKDLVGWQVGWVLRYSGLVKCRGIIHTKGYIVKLIRNTQGYNFSPQ
ncbi:glutamate--cysteine ligase regulatory subunit-like isoform X2 [Symsagittifera roscoffensis]|uniref:glutamate--cysteine ligase regulatory subunit-like isoform X2 n=1 Tax=Symsagittifera roscoffensis TaxID=84072 RepID=UPI00307B3F4E